ncbi:hypothetical protein Tco_0413891 [Tanacetum coccineum]
MFQSTEGVLFPAKSGLPLERKREKHKLNRRTLDVRIFIVEVILVEITIHIKELCLLCEWFTASILALQFCLAGKGSGGGGKGLTMGELGLQGKRGEDAELKTLIATYDIPLDLRPRLPDSNFRMINLPVGDTAIGIYSRIFDSSGVRIPFSSFLLAVLKYFKVHISQLVPLGLSKGDWFSFAKRGGSATVCMEVTKSGLKQWKEKFFLIDRRAIPFHMPWRHPDSCITDKVPTGFNQSHVDRLRAHIVKLRSILEGVLVRSGLSRVWRNPMCDPVLRRLDNTVMSIYDFLCMPSLDKAAVREEPHELDIVVTRPDRNVVTKADHAAKRKASTGPEISTNATKKTRSSKKVSGAGSSEQAAGDEVEQTDDGTLDDDDQRDGPEFAMEGNESLHDVSPDKEADPHQELSGDVTRTTRASFHAPHGTSEDVSPRAQEGAPALDRDLLPVAPGPYCIPYPYDENPGCESPPYTKDDWEEIHGVNLGLRKKELYKDPKVCRTGIDRFPTPAEIHRLGELSSVELSDHMSVLQCQLITHGRALNARYDHSLRNQSESTVRADEKVSRLSAQLEVLKSKCETTKQKLSSWGKKHRKYRNERDALAIEKAKIEEELAEARSQLEHRGRQAEEIQDSIASFFQSDFTPLVRRFLKSGEFNQAFAGVLSTAISVRVERGLRMDRTDEEFKELSQSVAGFIPDAKEKFDRVVAAFPDTAFPFLDKVSKNSQSSLPDIARLEPDRVAPSH